MNLTPIALGFSRPASEMTFLKKGMY
uniref:Uncharacterized protein n=1 Tax=Arundo donax TaxID=35708 RepID=A0A0A9FJU1_ARUDO